MNEKSLKIQQNNYKLLKQPRIISILCLLALASAEALSTLILPVVGMIVHGFILILLLLLSSLNSRKWQNHLLPVLALVPLTRLLSLMSPLRYFPQIYWYAVVGVPLLIAVYSLVQLTGLRAEIIGLRLSWRQVPTQLLIGISGILLGYLGYLILRPEPLISELNWRSLWLPALILLFFTGFLEEVIFRGLLQTAACREFGGWGVLYVAILFAVLHLGCRSVLHISFVFAVAVTFGILTRWSKSLVGVSLAHGLTNIMLYLVFPFQLSRLA